MMDSKSASWVIETNLSYLRSSTAWSPKGSYTSQWSAVWETWFLSEEEAGEVEANWAGAKHLFHKDMKPRSLDACLSALRENREEREWPNYRIANKASGVILYAGVLAKL